MKLTPGKLAGMKAVSNERGVIAAAAMTSADRCKRPYPRKGLGRFRRNDGMNSRFW